MSPNRIVSRSRSASAPDLPTAITMRPQFGSSPAMAVLTSGELAIESATRRAAASGGAGDRHLDELRRPLAVAHHLVREIAHHARERRREAGRPRVAARRAAPSPPGRSRP